MSRIVSVWLPRWPILRFLAAQVRSLATPTIINSAQPDSAQPDSAHSYPSAKSEGLSSRPSIAGKFTQPAYTWLRARAGIQLSEHADGWVPARAAFGRLAGMTGACNLDRRRTELATPVDPQKPFVLALDAAGGPR